ncbi:MAG: hypothetical protein AB7Y46_19710 [Armatimonadota bacterium]
MRRIARLAVPGLLLLLALPLLLAACSSDDGGTGSSMTGAWMPEKGALTFRAGADGSGYEYDPNASKPAGGVIVAENGGAYWVTLVSADGDRFSAGAAVPQDDMLLVRIGASAPGPHFFLSSDGTDSAQLIAAQKASPMPQAWSIHLVPGPLLESEQ